MPSQLPDESASWQSVRWPDGSSYEGLVKGESCHIRGVFNFSDGDRYEGEYLNNQMEGLGFFCWHDGTTYKGAWKRDRMHGCGIKVSCDDSGYTVSQEGLFVNDEFVGPSSVCDTSAAQLAAKQAMGAARLACAFELVEKPESSRERQTHMHDRGSLTSHTDAFKQRQNRSTQATQLAVSHTAKMSRTTSRR